jgi:hypothetical protein
MSSYSGVSLSAVGASSPILILPNSAQRYLPILALGLVCTVSSGASLVYSVQVTADSQGGSILNWNNHDVLVNQSGSANGNILYPVSAVRLVVTSWTSGSVNLGVAQWP